jgi:hypothetical protein
LVVVVLVLPHELLAALLRFEDEELDRQIRVRGCPSVKRSGYSLKPAAGGVPGGRRRAYTGS